MSKFRHEDLHPNPEVLQMTATRAAAAEIELGEHIDGRWMWAFSWREGFSAHGFACAAKWDRFAGTRAEALDAAIKEMRAEVQSEVLAWLETLSRPVQTDMFELPSNARHKPTREAGLA